MASAVQRESHNDRRDFVLVGLAAFVWLILFANLQTIDQFRQEKIK